eukprot:286750-Rhodomonas_salina.1
MSGYSAGFPPDVFETALRHARPLAGHHLTDMWVRFTEARLTVLHARAASTTQANQVDKLVAALSNSPMDALEAQTAWAGQQARIAEARRALLEAQAEVLDAERAFGDVLEEIRSDPSFYGCPPIRCSE